MSRSSKSFIETTTDKATKEAHFSVLTASRFFAALAVLFYHLPALNQALQEDGHTLLQREVGNGFAAVTYFFVLSGFVLAHGYAKEFEKLSCTGLLKFYRLRLARIVPVWAFFSTPFLIRIPDSVWLQYVTFTQAWSTSSEVAFAYLAVTWTLSVEFFFYITFPFIVRFVHSWRIGWRWPVLIIFGLAIPMFGALYFSLSGLSGLPTWDPSGPHRWLYRNPLMRFGDFLTGIGLHFVFTELSRSQSAFWSFWVRRAFVSLATCLLIIAALATLPVTHWSYDAQFLAPFALLIILLAVLENSHGWRAPKSLILLGQASYALYLGHFIYGRVLIDPLQSQTGANKYGFSLWLTVFLILISLATYQYIEVPLQKILRGTQNKDQ